MCFEVEIKCRGAVKRHVYVTFERKKKIKMKKKNEKKKFLVKSYVRLPMNK